MERRWLRGIPIQLLLWTTVPAMLILIALTVAGIVGHQRAMRELVQARDARLARTAAARLSDRLEMQAGQLEALAAEIQPALSPPCPPPGLGAGEGWGGLGGEVPSQDPGPAALDQHPTLTQPFDRRRLELVEGLRAGSFDRGVALISPQGHILETFPHDTSTLRQSLPRGIRGAQGAAGLSTSPDWSTLQSPIQSLTSTELSTGLSNALSSSTRVSPVIDDPVSGQRLLLMAVPAGENWLVGGVSLRHLGVDALVADSTGASRSAPTPSTELGARLSTRLSLGVEGRAYLIDETGEVLVASGNEPEVASLRGQPGVNAALRGEAGAVVVPVEGTVMVVAYAPVPPVGWALITQEPWAAVVDPMMRFSLVAPLLLVVAAVAALITLLFGLRFIVRPLQQLDRQAAQLAWGNFEAVRTPVGGTPEIEDLRRTLDDLARQIRTYQQGLRDYIGAITRGQEEERKRLARELHDDTAQDLIALGHRVEMARRVLERDPAAAAERLEELKALINATLTEVRRFTRALRPIYLEDLGLLPALEMLVRDISTGSVSVSIKLDPRVGLDPRMHRVESGADLIADGSISLTTRFRVSGPARRLPEELELAVYRIAQEALTNVVQHSRATQATVELRFTDDEVTLTVTDDGVGFEVPERPEGLARAGHFGLVGMQERAALVGGRLVLESEAGRGTRVTARLPIPAVPRDTTVS